jgi:nitrogen fixation/metabolism regulation signal transduction histidine kinase
MAAAMEQALERLREQERAMKARAEASERLSDEIVASITSGLLVVTGDRRVRTLNPAGRRILGVPELPELVERTGRPDPPMTEVLRSAAPLAAVVEECLSVPPCTSASRFRPSLTAKVERREPSASSPT